jgi:hypothetical protein
MNTNNRRPNGWTSADAAGLAILPGLVRYDEVYDPNVAEIRHAFRVTVRTTNGFVYPASHKAGSTAGALPMGARLRLKPSVDITQRTSDPNIQKIFRAMQRYGLIVADNGSDMYLTGTYDTRWNNDILNPAFAKLSASDFEVIQLGYNSGSSTVPVALASLSISPASVTGGQQATGTVTLTAGAPAGGATIGLSDVNPAATVPSSVGVPANSTSVTFPITTSAVGATSMGNVTASYAGVTKSASVAVKPPVLVSLTLNPATVRGGTGTVGKITLSGPAPAAGMRISLASSKAAAGVPASVAISGGTSTVTFPISTAPVNTKTVATISSSFSGVAKSATLTIQRR